VLEDEQTLFKAEEMAEEDELPPVNGAVADMTGLKHAERSVLLLNWA
jgi:hypothetical protein